MDLCNKVFFFYIFPRTICPVFTIILSTNHSTEVPPFQIRRMSNIGRSMSEELAHPIIIASLVFATITIIIRFITLIAVISFR